MTRSLAALLMLFGLAITLCHPLLANDATESDRTFEGASQRREGRLGVPFKTKVTLDGIVIEGPSKGFEGGPNIVVQRINGRATQKFIRLRVVGHVKDATDLTERTAWKIGQSYQLEGREDGSIVGGERSNRDGLPLQTLGGPTFVPYFDATERRRIDTPLGPADFNQRQTLLQGTALHVQGLPYLAGNGWLLKIPKLQKWPDNMVGRQVEGLGVVAKSPEPAVFDFNEPQMRLVQLQDQVNQKVSLRGTARSMNGYWWLDYRGQPVHVENMPRLKRWTPENHGCPVQIDGQLEVARLADPRDQGRTDSNLGEWFIVRRASWKPIDALLTPERRESYE